ncbi:MBG domain-containing protein [Novosphingobium rosa]|uniref:MBG domain-containing protein n=1 Tax=Novosphingobium rosa TaxID=76978 RepID=UPI00082C6B4A|nr:MBG domain-containing protein [Novosphingobium rosa]
MQHFKQLTLAASTSALALLTAMTASPAWAQAPLPVGGAVASGQAQIGAPSGGNLSINQSSAQAIINWQSFDVAAGHGVTFNQPDAGSATLNRVTGNTASTIAGQISANGSVYLINPNGIQITKSGVVNVGRGFVASTLDIADADFLAGKGAFGGTGGAIGNAGTITTKTGGYVGLLGGSVSNTGLILAPAGQVVIGAGTTATLDLNGDSFLQVALPTDAALTANGAAAALTGAQARDAVRNIVNLPGSINARNVSGESGNVLLSGTINVDSASGDAGHIMVLGHAVTANGTLTARALGATGKGGLVETSGNTVDFTGIHVDTSAAHGSTGTWLIDPADVTIDATTASDISNNLANNNVFLQTAANSVSGGGVSSAPPISVGPGDIYVNSAITWSSNNSLTLSAFHSIIFNAPVTASGNGGLNLTTNNNADGTSSGGMLTFNSGGRVQLLGSNASLSINSTTYTLIHSVADLLNINTNLAGNYALAQPIDMGGTTYTQSPIAPWINGPDVFSGNFNGLNNTIKNLTIVVSNPAETSIGLFGAIGTQMGYNTAGTVSNLGLYGGSVINNQVSNVFLGTLAGANSGTISNVWSSASVSSNQFGAEIGGLVGYNWGTITNSYASGSVTGTGLLSWTGGLVGYNDGYSASYGRTATDQPGIITNSYATGAVHGGSGTGGTANGGGSGSDTGGLVGGNYGMIANVYSSGTVTATPGTYIDGLVGENDTRSNGGIASVTNGYWDSTTTHIGTVSTGAGTPLTTAQLQNGSLPSGLSSAFWQAGSGAYPVLLQSAIPLITLTYSVSNTAGTYGTLASLGLATLSGTPANVSGVVSLYSTNSNGVLSGLINLSATLAAGTYYQGVSALAGSAAGNYAIAGAGNLIGTLTISPLAVLLAGTQVYNASRTVNGSSLSVANLIQGDTVTVGGSAINGVASPNVGTNQSLSSLSGLTLSNANYTLAGGSGVLTITPASLTVTGAKTYDGTNSFASGSLTASGGVGGEVVTIVSGTGSAGSQNVGTTMGGLNGLGIAVSGGQGLASNYALPGSGLLTITPASLTITPLAQSVTYGAASTLNNAQNVGYSQSGLVNGDAITGLTLATTGTGAASGTTGSTGVGSYAINASNATGNGLGNYTISYGPAALLTVNPALLTYSVANAQSTFGTQATPGGITLNGVTAGDLANVSGTLGIFGGGTPVTLSTITPAGTYSQLVTGLTGSAAGNYILATSGNAPGTLTVNKLALTGTIAAGASTYGDLLTAGNVTFTNLVAGAGQVTGTVSIATSGNTSTSGHLKAGAYSGIQSLVSISGADAANYSFAGMTGDYTVSQLALTGSIASGVSTYGSALTPGAVSFGNLVAGDAVAAGAVTIATSGNTSSSGHLKAGSYSGIQSMSSVSGADAGNYSFAGLTGDYTVNQLALSGSIAPGASTYGSALTPGAVSFGNAIAGDQLTPGAVTLATTGNTSSSGHLKAGSYSGIQSMSSIGGADAGNYSFAGLTGDYTVNQLALNGSIAPGVSTYGSALTPGAASFNNVLAGDVVAPGGVTVATTGNLSGSGHLKAGSYTGIESVSTIGGADAANYSFAGLTGDYTVNQLTLTGTLANASSTYGAALTPGTVSFANLVAGDAVTPGAVTITTTGNLSGSGHLNAGSYAGIQSVSTMGGADAGNYNFAGLSGNYTVSRAALNISANSGQSMVYGASMPVLLYTQTGLVSGDSLSGALATGAVQGSNVGSYAIGQGSLTAGSNYTVTYTGANFAVTPATLTYVADPATRFANTANPVFSGSVTGFLLKDTLASATTGTLSFTSSATPQSAPGLYGIAGSGLSAGNYVFVQAPANAVALTVNPATSDAASRTVSQNTVASNAQSSVNDVRAASSSNDVDPAEIINQTGSSDLTGTGAPPKGLCVSYGPGKPKVCISH